MSDLVTSRIFVDGEKGITAAKLNDIIAGASVQTDFVATKPTASTLDPADNLLVLKSSGQYAKTPFQTIVDSVQGQLPSNDSEIWSVRLRSFNSVGNCNFECDQRSVGATLTNPATGTLPLDRWAHGKVGTMVVSVGQQAAALPDVCVPTTSFRITRSFYRVTLTTAQASLGVSDTLRLSQSIEGPMWRELSNDVHSLQVLVRSSVANLKFALAFSDPATTTKTLVKLATIPTANTWTLLTFPNLPVWPSGNFSASPGVLGYLFSITLAAGANLTSPAADTWQSGSFLGAPGMSSFAASPVNSTFDIAFIQHEPGPVCSTLIDKPFTQNLTECQRYFAKSMPYATAVGADSAGFVSFHSPVAVSVSTSLFGGRGFPVPMAKAPTVTFFKHDDGTGNQGYYYNSAVPAGAAIAFTGSSANQNALTAIRGNASLAGPIMIITGFTADTGW